MLISKRLRAASRISPLVAAALAVWLLAGCETPPGPFVPTSAIAPDVVYCNDCTGHKPGTQPWIIGGTCCCTPSQELMQQYHADGFCQGMTAEDLRKMYEEAGIVLASPECQFSNGLGPGGHHVVMGGKSLIPPTPGTEYYEMVVTGQRPPGSRQQTAKKDNDHDD